MKQIWGFPAWLHLQTVQNNIFKKHLRIGQNEGSNLNQGALPVHFCSRRCVHHKVARAILLKSHSLSWPFQRLSTAIIMKSNLHGMPYMIWPHCNCPTSLPHGCQTHRPSFLPWSFHLPPALLGMLFPQISQGHLLHLTLVSASLLRKAFPDHHG